MSYTDSKGGPLMIKKGGKLTIVGTVSGGGWQCNKRGGDTVGAWGPDLDIRDQRFNAVSAHMDWISKVIQGKNAEQCALPKSPGDSAQNTTPDPKPGDPKNKYPRRDCAVWDWDCIRRLR